MTTPLDATPTSVRPPDASTWNAPARDQRRAPGLFDARPANDTTLTAVELPPRSAHAPAVAARVGPVRRTFTPAWVATYSVPTCAECGAEPAAVLVEWPPHYRMIERDGKEFPACLGCWRKERTAVPTPKPAQIALERNAYALDRRILAALRSLGRATIVEICQTLELLGEGERGSQHGEQRTAYESVRDGVYRLEDAGRVKRRRRGRRVQFEAKR